MRAKVVEISWHDTQPVYSCDFQPIPPAQLKRILPFPQPNQIPTSSTSATEGLQASASTNSTGSKQGPSPCPTPGPSSLQSERPTSQGGASDTADVKVSGIPSIPSGGGSHRQYRLATAGADKNVRIWMVYPNVVTHAAPNTQQITPHPPRIVYLSTLRRHTAAVNVVRWSPNGQTLASAGDDGLIILWVPSDLPPSNFGEESAEEMGDKEYWRDKRAINVTKQEIYDIAWSPDGKYIIAGSTDNLAQVFSVADGSCVHQIQDHSHYVQGVAWDPLNEFLATQSSDRTVQVHSVSQRNNTLTIHPASRDRSGRGTPHAIMEIKNSRAPSFSMVRPSVARRASTVSDAGSTVTLTSELPDAAAVPPIPSSLSNTVPSTPLSLSNMNPPSNKPSSRRSSFSSTAAANSPLLAARDSFRGGRSPSPAPLPAIRPAPLTAQSIHQKLYGDELATNFFRRLTFSPDGGLLFTPAGQIEEPHYPLAPTSEDDSSIPKPKTNAIEGSKSTVYIYSRANLARPPIAHLPGHKTTTVAVRFSPIFYDLRPMADSGPIPPKKIILDKKNPAPVQVSIDMPPPSVSIHAAPTSASMFALPYRLMYAVAAQDSVLLYDTQQAGPIAIFKGLHYSAFTDVAWSPAGDSLVLTSSDGYCSIVVFDAAELGALHPTQQHHRQLQAIAQSHSSGHASTAHSLPPSPAPGHAIPSISNTPKAEGSTGSASVIPTPSTSFQLPGRTTPAEPSTSASTSGDSKVGTIFGLPVGTSNAQPPTPRTSAPGSPAAIISAPGKREGEDVKADGQVKLKKRRIELTRVE
ncbi:hypothetical protein NliqN6_5288 [Naganishia liquefaciens]|uniref:CAF1B/HIR1 beta-propeller domain-containing protein n=1 Tax=Naganishia liquefaciens TaxID=104408 RepID=A0A8H3YIT3_9TREE|nr:hypothetical protein NliqN6_5288 [Naganishia liquefaciens]